MKFLQAAGGFVVSLALSPLSPLTTVPFLKLLIKLGLGSDRVGDPNYGLLALLAIVSLVTPVIGFFVLRRRFPYFAGGLLVGALTTGFLGYFLVLTTLTLPNY